MGTKGEMSFPPSDRDMDCRACSGHGWKDFTVREHDLIAKLDSFHQEVFGSPYFEVHNTAHWGQLPSERFCQKCCGQERRASDNSQFAQWRLDLRALKTLVSRVQRGERFGDIETAHKNYATSENSLSEGIQARMIIASGRTYTSESVYMRIAKKTRPRQNRTGSARNRPSLSDELVQLANLKESGDLTEEEFKLAKQKLLGSSGVTNKNHLTFSVGDRVSHHQLGSGRVTSISGSGPTTEIEINFDGMGKKLFLLAIAPLTKL
jgi:hypothetical protein